VIDAIIRLPNSPPRSRGSSSSDDITERQQQLRDLIGDDLAAAYKLDRQAAAPDRGQRAPRQGPRRVRAPRTEIPSAYLASLSR
jgi:hypothetical protein